MSQEELEHVLDQISSGDGTSLDEHLDSDKYDNTPSEEVLEAVVDDLPDSAMTSSLSLEKVDYRAMIETNDGYVQTDLESVTTPGRVEGTIHTSDDFLADQVAESLETDSIDFSLNYRDEENTYKVTLMG